MGDPKKATKKYSKPSHPWRKDRIESESILVKEYGFKNKKEIWKLGSLLKNFAQQAKKSIVATTEQAELEKKNLINRLTRLGFIKQGGQIDDILSLTLVDLCERRLQTIVFRKRFARTMGQARQFIVHGHITVNSNKITAPGYIVSTEDEALIAYSANSSLTDEMHPERNLEKEKVVEKEKIVEKEKVIEKKEVTGKEKVIEKEKIVEKEKVVEKKK